jgi:hypothetical protein
MGITYSPLSQLLRGKRARECNPEHSRALIQIKMLLTGRGCPCISPGDAADKRANAGPRTPLGGAYVAGTSADGFAWVK